MSRYVRGVGKSGGYVGQVGQGRGSGTWCSIFGECMTSETDERECWPIGRAAG